MSTSTLGRSVSLDEAGRLLGVSRRTIYNYIHDARLQTIQVQQSQRVLRSSLVEFGIPDLDSAGRRDEGVPLPCEHRTTP